MKKGGRKTYFAGVFLLAPQQVLMSGFILRIFDVYAHTVLTLMTSEY